MEWYFYKQLYLPSSGQRQKRSEHIVPDSFVIKHASDKSFLELDILDYNCTVHKKCSMLQKCTKEITLWFTNTHIEKIHSLSVQFLQIFFAVTIFLNKIKYEL